MYKIEDYHYCLPESLISQRPPDIRGNSRLLLLNRKSGQTSHHSFNQIDNFLRPSDVLVVNNTKVIPGKLIGKKKTGGKVEILILNFAEHIKQLSEKPKVFQCLIKASKHSLPGTTLFFKKNLKAIVLNFISGIYHIEFANGNLLKKIIYEFGQLPLPPYIKRNSISYNNNDLLRYQTIYANQEGSIAAPTAGLHFTKEIMKRIKNIGIKIVTITLHVGYGTFAPIRVSDIRKHKIHSELFSIEQNEAEIINKAKANGNRVVAVGTTSVRTLEFLANKNKKICKSSGKCNLYIHPGYNFKLVDAIITNFHLPCSTLLMLVSAFSDRSTILKTYKLAIEKKYRFFSYGDAMLIY